MGAETPPAAPLDGGAIGDEVRPSATATREFATGSLLSRFAVGADASWVTTG